MHLANRYHLPIRSSPWLKATRFTSGNEEGEFYCVDFRALLAVQSQARHHLFTCLWDNLVLLSSLDANLYALDAHQGG
jgi:hypothetical protein